MKYREPANAVTLPAPPRTYEVLRGQVARVVVVLILLFPIVSPLACEGPLFAAGLLTVILGNLIVIEVVR